MSRRMSRPRRLVAGLAAALLAASLTGAAKPYPQVIQLPVDWGAEGLAVVGHTFYASSLYTGSIYRGDLRTGTGSVLVDVDDRAALGIEADVPHQLLFVAGGGTGEAYVYDLRTGSEVASYDLDGILVNDVVVTESAAYFTETFAPRLYKIPIGEDGSLGPAQVIPVTGPAAAPTSGFGLNGIDATADGSTLIVAHSDFGKLYTIDPDTGASREIVLTSGSLVPGTPDGILRSGHDVWVAENFANEVVKVEVSPHWRTGAVTTTITNPHFEVPTALGQHGDRLATVNAKFDLGFPPPFGPGAPAGTPFEVVQFRAR